MERLVLRRPPWWAVIVVAFLSALLALGAVAVVHARSVGHAAPELSLGDAMLTANSAGGGIFLQYTGVTGAPSTSHTNHAPVLSVQWGGNTRSIASGAVGAERHADPPTTTDLCVTRLEDGYSPKFMVQSLSGQSKSSIIYFLKPSADGVVHEYMRIEMKDTLISNFKFNSKGDNTITETMCLNFTQVNVVFSPSGGHASQSVSWDYVAQSPLP